MIDWTYYLLEMVGLINSIKIKDEDENYDLEVEIKNVASNQNLHMSKIENSTGCSVSKLQNQNVQMEHPVLNNIYHQQQTIFLNKASCRDEEGSFLLK